ncbi:hypothetical protein DFJ73DRAFT_822230 [Zopfochytrium polystomum]|nr:hypothetical protein DFJ73DRAFT_822230 [Zopfochytrium polystomum]
MAFPGFVSRAGAGGADLAIELANDWGLTSYLRTSTLTKHRTIENGFTLFRCASSSSSSSSYSPRGLSGAFSPRGEVLHLQETSTNEDGRIETAAFKFPVKPRIATLYVRAGWLFGWGCIAVCGWILSLVVFYRRLTGIARKIIGLGVL